MYPPLKTIKRKTELRRKIRNKEINVIGKKGKSYIISKEEIERYAIKEGIMRITSEVSITARPFFEKQGYIVEVEQKRRANQLCLTNYWMAKNLTK